MGRNTLPLYTAGRGCWALHCGWAGGPEAATPAAEAANLLAADRNMLDGLLIPRASQDAEKLVAGARGCTRASCYWKSTAQYCP